MARETEPIYDNWINALLRISGTLAARSCWDGIIQIDELPFKETDDDAVFARVTAQMKQLAGVRFSVVDVSPETESQANTRYQVISQLRVQLENLTMLPIELTNQLVRLHGEPAAALKTDFGTRVAPAAISHDASVFTVTDAGGNTITAAWTEVTAPGVKPAFELTADPALEVDWKRGEVQHVELDADSTLTFANLVDGREHTLLIKQGAGAPWVPTLPAGIVWPGATAPTWATTAGHTDRVEFLYVDSVLYGTHRGNYHS